MRPLIRLRLLALLLTAALGGFAQTAKAPASGEIGARAVLAPESEPGERMLLTGTLLDAAGKPVANASIYAYHTDARGLYNNENRGGPGNRHPRLHGTVRTGPGGNFELVSIRPAPYPQSRVVAHIHFVVTPEGGAPQNLEALLAGDPNLSPGLAAQLEKSPDRRSLLKLTRGADGAWRGTVTLRLP